MVLADFGVAFVIVIGLAVVGAVLARSQYKRRHPPLTSEEKTAQLEAELARENERIEKIKEMKIQEWDT